MSISGWRNNLILSSPRRILYIIDGIEFGGGERVFLQLARELKHCFHVMAAAMPYGKFEKDILRAGIEFFPVDMRRQLSFKTIRRIVHIMRSQRIDIVHSQGARADFYARVSGRIAGVPYNVCTVAAPVETFDISFLRKSAYRFADSLTQRYVNRFIIVSDFLKRMMIEHRKISPCRLERIYNGIELDAFDPQTRMTDLKYRLGIKDNHIIVGAIGRMIPIKGFECLIQAIPEVVRHIPDVKFLFVGDGPMKKELYDRAEKLGVNNEVCFIGFRNDVRDILSIIDVVAVPSIVEGFPMIILEAMAMAKPIVATQLPGIMEQISHEKQGLLIPPDIPHALAHALLRILRDRSLAEKLGHAARKRVEACFSLEKMITETKKVYLSF